MDNNNIDVSAETIAHNWEDISLEYNVIDETVVNHEPTDEVTEIGIDEVKEAERQQLIQFLNVSISSIVLAKDLAVDEAITLNWCESTINLMLKYIPSLNTGYLEKFKEELAFCYASFQLAQAVKLAVSLKSDELKKQSQKQEKQKQEQEQQKEEG